MKKAISSIIFLLFLFALNWPTDAAAQVFWSEDFSEGIPDDWLVSDDSGQGVNWVYCASPSECLPVGSVNCSGKTIEYFYAPTSSNGFALLPSPSLSAPHLSRMVSGAIDCSGYNRVFLQFQTNIATCNEAAVDAAKLKVRVNGETHIFTPFPALTADAPQRAPLRFLVNERSFPVTIDLSEVAAGQDSVELIWEWEANNELAWLVDDILLSATHPAAPENAVYFESFPFGPNGWTSEPLAETEADSNWQWVAGGNLSNAFSVKQNDAFGPYLFMHSATAADGAMVFNADFYSTEGVAPPSAVTFYLCDLVSPPIDLSEVQQPVALRLTHLASLGNTAPAAPSTANGARFLLTYSYSTDGGENWSDPLPVNPYLTPVTSTNFERIPPHFRREYFALPSLEGEEDVRVKFTWAGDLFFWAIDDVAIVERPSVDLRTNRNFHARTPNTVTPISQLTDVPLLADVENIGAQPVENIQQTFTATTDGQTVYTDEQTINALEVDSLFENQLFPNLLPAEALQATGQYRAAYGLSGQGATQRPEDDQQHWPFAVSDTLFAKENGFTRDIAPISAFNYTYGNCFYVPNGEGWYARTLSFAVGNADQLSDADRLVNTLLYEWAGDLNGNGKADGAELEEKAINFYKFKGDEGVKQITLPVSNDGVGVALKDSTYYLAMVNYGAIQQPPLFMLVSDTIDYQATYFAHEQAGLPRPYGGMLQVGSEGGLSFETIGFGLNIVPTVRLSIGESPVLSRQERLLPAHSLQLSPNPATDEVTVTIDLPDKTVPATLRLLGQDGATLRQWTLPRLEHTHQFSVAGLPAGLYYVQLRTGNRGRTVKLVVGD